MRKQLPPTSNRLTQDLERLAFEHHDACTSCGHRFVEAETSHWGYDSGRAPMYVCEGCSPQLKEVARREYFMVRPYQVPDPETPLWRYMDFTKFVGLLSTKSLYFPSAESFEDPFEGAKGFRKRKEHWDGFYLDFFRSAVRSIPGRGAQLSEIQIEKEATDLLRQMEQSGQLDRRTTFISCWHENTHESEAMWRLYSAYIDNAIAVRTSYQRLYEALGRDVRIRIGRVEYLDLDADFAGPNDAFWRKRKSFEHEREVRAVISEPDSQKSGILVPCDVDRLIAGVVVSPKSPTWFVELAKDVTSKYGFGLNVSPSSLNEEPFF